MNILIVGKGGREQALMRAVKAGGCGEYFLNAETEPEKLKQFLKNKKIELAVIGPEKELAEGLSDFLRKEGVLTFGPSQSSARLESSKLFAKEFMSEAGVPTASYKEIGSISSALSLSKDFPVVLKASGLAGGKGVFICQNLEDLKKAGELIFEKKIFGSAGKKAFLESYKTGWELSVFILTNGEDYKLLPFARDYKKLHKGDKGPNTGGMGAVAPHFISEDLKKEIHEKILKPTIQEIKKRRLLYRGVLYIGLMITKSGPVVLEYNVRFGDPEAQTLLPLLDGSWAEVFKQTAQGQIPNLKWKKNTYSACVVLAAPGYPMSPQKNLKIEGDLLLETPHSYFLPAGVKKNSAGKWVTNGGRVLNAIGIGETKEEALQRAYALARRVQWEGLYFRPDIGT